MTELHPALHDLVTVLRAPAVALSGSDGQIRPGGPQGWYHGDHRALAELVVEVLPGRLTQIGRGSDGPDVAEFHAALRTADAVDPTGLVRRHRQVADGSLVEQVSITQHAAEQRFTVRVRLAADLAGIDAVKGGRGAPRATPAVSGGEARWQDADTEVRVSYPAATRSTVDDGVLVLEWDVVLGPQQTWTVVLSATCRRVGPAVFAPSAPTRAPRWTAPPALDDRLRPLVAASLADLNALLLADPAAPDDVFAAAGSPWYLTLFGRDSLWTARLLLPLGTELAGGTLRALARRQGVRHDPDSEEAPGKIPHEARAAALDTGEVRIPPLYYGTIDATALWVILLHDAWRAGLSEDEVRALLPNLLAAMMWLTGPDADPDSDGLVEYIASTAGGLTNQGWKDSHDGIRHVDGRAAAAPLALCEVQGYGYQAAHAAAALATEFDLPGAAHWLTWAERLHTRFHRAFWLSDRHGDYPAVALDADKRPVTGATSNMAHLLGTGLLDADQSAAVAARLAHPDLTTPHGLRTLSSESAGYNPESYHCGSIWPHDTAIAIEGLAAEGHHDLARRLALGLVAAAERGGGRVPELYAALDGVSVPLAYPTSCAPQAWSAAAVVTAARHLSD